MKKKEGKKGCKNFLKKKKKRKENKGFLIFQLFKFVLEFSLYCIISIRQFESREGEESDFS